MKQNLAAAVFASLFISGAHASDDRIDVLDHTLTIQLELADQSLTAVQTTHVRLLAPGVDRLSFSANGLEISAATVDGRNAQMLRSTELLTLELPVEASAGSVLEVQISYSGRPDKGLTFDHGMAFTSYHTCSWMFCRQDAPGDKAAFELVLTTSAEMSAVASGALVADVQVDGARRRTWREERPMPNFGYGFAVGDFATVDLDGGDLHLRAHSATASSDELSAMLTDTSAMLEFFQEKAGAPFPFDGFDQIIVAGHAAQEGDGFSVLGYDTLQPILTDATEDWAIAHELAHQWWGVLVTPEDWSEMWLSEGLATFMVAEWKRRRWGEAYYDRELELARNRWGAAKADGWDVGLAFDGEHPSLRARRAITYSKGMIFLDQMKLEIGDAAFWDGIRTFTQTHALGTVDSDDFKAAMESAAGADLSALFDEWID